MVEPIRSPVPKQGDRGGETMDKIPATHRTDLSGYEEAAHRDSPDLSGQDGGVVMRLIEQAGASSVAGEQPCSIGAPSLEEGVKIAVGRFGVSQMKADSAAQGDPIVHCHRAGIAVHPDHRADEVVAWSGLIKMLIDQASDVEAVVLEAGDLYRRKAVLHLIDHGFDGGGAGHFVHDVAVRLGHGKRLAVGPASLGYHRLHLHSRTDEHAHRPLIERPVTGDQPASPGTERGRRISAVDRGPWATIAYPAQEPVDRRSE